MYTHTERVRVDVSEDQLVAIMTVLAIVGTVASVAVGGIADTLIHATYYATGSGALSGGVEVGADVVVEAGIDSAGLGGSAVAGVMVVGAVGAVFVGV